MKIDVAIIGAGPSGMTAGIFACRGGLNVVCFEQMGIGGLASLIYNVENFPSVKSISGFELSQNIFNQAESCGVKFNYEKVVAIERLKSDIKITTNENEYIACKVIIACGSKTRKLNIEGEAKFTGKGVSYCASCDGAIFKNKIVAVVGGGNSAIDNVKYLSNLADKIYLINRTDNFRANEVEIQKIKKLDNVEILTSTVVEKINGNEVVESIDVDCDNKKTNIKIDGLFVAIGSEPCLDFIDFELDKDENGYIKVDKDMRTSVNNVYACGDTISKEFKQIITACADGAIAGNSCIRG